jgi:hypothetical protein
MPLGLQVFEASRRSRQLAHEGGKIVSHMHRAPLPQVVSILLMPVKRPSRPHSRGEAGRIVSLKSSTDTIRNRTLHLPACSLVPQLSAQPRATFTAIYCMQTTHKNIETDNSRLRLNTYTYLVVRILSVFEL